MLLKPQAGADHGLSSISALNRPISVDGTPSNRPVSERSASKTERCMRVERVSSIASMLEAGWDVAGGERTPPLPMAMCTGALGMPWSL